MKRKALGCVARVVHLEYRENAPDFQVFFIRPHVLDPELGPQSQSGALLLRGFRFRFAGKLPPKSLDTSGA